MQLMCNLHTLYFLLAGYAEMAFVHWLNNLHTYLGLLTYTLRCNLCVLENVENVKQESRAAARKPRDAASVLFG